MCNHIIRRNKFCENRKKNPAKRPQNRQKTRKNSQITQNFQTKIRKNTANPRKVLQITKVRKNHKGAKNYCQ